VHQRTRAKTEPDNTSHCRTAIVKMKMMPYSLSFVFLALVAMTMVMFSTPAGAAPVPEYPSTGPEHAERAAAAAAAVIGTNAYQLSRGLPPVPPRNLLDATRTVPSPPAKRSPVKRSLDADTNAESGIDTRAPEAKRSQCKRSTDTEAPGAKRAPLPCKRAPMPSKRSEHQRSSTDIDAHAALA
jgi:hypothetical protein